LSRGASPTCIESKAYMHVGFSWKRLSFENMPSHGDIRKFTTELCEETGYRIVDGSEESRVVLLSKLGKHVKYDKQ
jgi:tRNA wybutosine-synthesizing protein 1